MSEIEKMYENANVKPFRYCYNCVDNNGNRIENSTNCPLRHNCSNTCDTPEYEFTAEKQIELIKLLAIQPLTIDNTDDEFEFSTEYESSDFGKFEESLAEIINNLWQDLSKEEKQQIRKILE